MNHAEHSKALQAEIVNYRLVLDSIRTLCRFGSPIQPGPLMNLCNKALDEPAGAVIAKEYSLLRLLEMFARDLLGRDAADPVRVTIVAKHQEVLDELNKLRQAEFVKAQIIKPASSGIIVPAR